jgi:hypothetical protein
MRDATKFKWSKTEWRGAAWCLPVIAAWVFIGIIRGHERWVVYAVAGAFSVSYGEFQNLGHRRVLPRAIMLVGTAAAAWAGNVAGFYGWYYWVLLATVSGFLFGAMTMLGYGAWWIGLRWMISLIVYGSHAAHPMAASVYGLALMAGGVSQLIFLLGTARFTDRWFEPQDQPPLNIAGSVASAMLRSVNPANIGGRYALRVAAAMAATTVIWKFWGLPNGYWTPMTAAILLKPDFHEASIRGINRLIGTLAGAGLMSLVLAAARPGPIALGALLLWSICCCLALMRVNYAIFVACVTGYVVLLFSTLGLPEPIVAVHRILATLVGAAVALAVSLIPIDYSERAVGERAVGGRVGG